MDTERLWWEAGLALGRAPRSAGGSEEELEGVGESTDEVGQEHGEDEEEQDEEEEKPSDTLLQEL